MYHVGLCPMNNEQLCSCRGRGGGTERRPKKQHAHTAVSRALFSVGGRVAMVNFSNESPFLQDDGSHDPEALCSTHDRSLALLKTLMQVGHLLHINFGQVQILLVFDIERFVWRSEGPIN